MYKPNKQSHRFYASHYQDDYTELGYDYRGNIFKKTISKVILKNKVNEAILNKVEPMITFLIDRVKHIKLQFMISLDKNDRNLN